MIQFLADKHVQLFIDPKSHNIFDLAKSIQKLSFEQTNEYYITLYARLVKLYIT